MLNLKKVYLRHFTDYISGNITRHQFIIKCTEVQNYAVNSENLTNELYPLFRELLFLINRYFIDKCEVDDDVRPLQYVVIHKNNLYWGCDIDEYDNLKLEYLPVSDNGLDFIIKNLYLKYFN